VTMEADRGPRLPGPVEAAAHFVVSEALANVAKYAGASAASVAVHRVDGHVTVEIADDGVGGADDRRGSGLRGLADRVEALDGRLRVVSPAGRGTVVTAELPSGGAIPATGTGPDGDPAW
jgi:signal transduction histidine kinase